MKDMTTENPILILTFQFSLDIINFVELLNDSRKWAIANQILRAGTSIGANATEAQNAESKADFIHKMKIAAKEADEVEYFLSLCQHSEHYPNCEKLLADILPIKKILARIISSSKNSMSSN